MENNRISRLKIAIVTNRFYPEVGGAETNIWFQAKELAKKHDVTIYCPKRIDRPWSEEFDGFRLVRMYDVLHPFCKYPNIATKTLCPSIFFRILFSGFDVIMFFPALNYNNKLAYFASRMRGIPIIGCFFDFIDYAAVIKEKGSVPDDILGQTLVKDTDARILRGLDHIYAIADKEIAFLQKFNGHVEYSPVPVLMDEYLKESPSYRSKYGISDNEFVFLCLGRVSQIKGQDIAVKAFCSAFRDRKDARLVIVGRHDYEPGFTDAMKKEIASAGMDGRVIFTGMVERPEVLGATPFGHTCHPGEIHELGCRRCRDMGVWNSCNPERCGRSESGCRRTQRIPVQEGLRGKSCGKNGRSICQKRRTETHGRRGSKTGQGEIHL